SDEVRDAVAPQVLESGPRRSTPPGATRLDSELMQVEPGAERGREIARGPAEGRAMDFGVAKECEADPVREVEPLVAVDGDRVGLLEPCHERCCPLVDAEERTECRIDVEPDGLCGAELGPPLE